MYIIQESTGTKYNQFDVSSLKLVAIFFYHKGGYEFL